MWDLLLLGATSFLAATFLPLSSELLLVSLQLQGNSIPSLWVVATTGNTLGALTNWWLGRYCLHFQSRHWFPVSEKQLIRAQNWFRRYGKWSLLFAWLPLVGDALTLLAGTMKVPAWQLMLLAGLGKGGRYGVIIWLTMQS